jgi:hypothetical protein
MMMVHLSGIEPASIAYQAIALPLSYRCGDGAGGRTRTSSIAGFGPAMSAVSSRMELVRAEGFEPATVLFLKQSPPTVGLRAHGISASRSQQRGNLLRIRFATPSSNSGHSRCQRAGLSRAKARHVSGSSDEAITPDEFLRWISHGTADHRRIEWRRCKGACADKRACTHEKRYATGRSMIFASLVGHLAVPSALIGEGVGPVAG